MIAEGKIEGKRGIRRKKMSSLYNMRRWTGLLTIESLTKHQESVEECKTREIYINKICVEGKCSILRQKLLSIIQNPNKRLTIVVDSKL